MRRAEDSLSVVQLVLDSGEWLPFVVAALSFLRLAPDFSDTVDVA